jgi:hypothetical protein
MIKPLPGLYRAGVMRTFGLATACLAIFATAPSMAQDCAAIQAACIDQCQGTAGSIGQPPLVFGTQTGRLQACINRCFIAPCQQTPLTARLCDATAQSICNNAFSACNNACVPSTATNAAGIESQAACGTFCCTQFKHCLTARQCDINAIIVINCSENPGSSPAPSTTP